MPEAFSIYQLILYDFFACNLPFIAFSLSHCMIHLQVTQVLGP